jgi:hypothetical protein
MIRTPLSCWELRVTELRGHDTQSPILLRDVLGNVGNDNAGETSHGITQHKLVPGT